MPVYEYRCDMCGHIFDAFQKIGDGNENLECPKCRTPRPTKIFSAFAATAASSRSSSVTRSCGTGGFS